MNVREEAQRFLDQYREAHGISSAPLPPAVANDRDFVDRALRETFTPEVGQDPQLRADLERMFALAVYGGLDAMLSDLLGRMQDDIDQTMATGVTQKNAATGINEGVNVGQRTLVSHLQTGQFNAVSMPVPDSEAYLVIFEDQMPRFTSLLSRAVAGAFPRFLSTDTSGMRKFTIDLSDVTQRIEADPTIANSFADIVVSYAVTGRFDQAFRSRNPLPPEYNGFAGLLEYSMLYFVIGHEYAHIMFGHLDSTTARKGLLPTTVFEEMAYSWGQEYEADFLGMILAINTCMYRLKIDFGLASLGVGLFFDAQDVMDRAVALLETGDENARQLGSHPPSDLRKQRWREYLSKLAQDAPEGDLANDIRMALEVGEVQTEFIRLMWELTRPILLNLHRQGVPAARTWRTIPKETGDKPSSAPRRPLLLPIGHYLGAHHRTGESGITRQVRRGTRVYDLTQEQYSVWSLAHGTLEAVGDLKNTAHWQRRTIEQRAISSGQADAGRHIDELLGMGLLTEVESGTDQELDFAKSHRLVPLMLGLGESTKEPGLLGIGFLRQRVLLVPHADYDLWQWSTMDDSLWATCQSAADAARRAGYTDPDWIDPATQLTGLLNALPALLLANAAYLDNCARFDWPESATAGYRSMGAATFADDTELTEPLIMPIGHYLGAHRPSAETEADFHMLRIGWETYKLEGSEQFAVWSIAHGRPEAGGDNPVPWTRSVIEEAARAQGISNVTSAMADLIAQDLLIEVMPGTPEAMEFAQVCRTRSLLIGFGNTDKDPLRYTVGHHGNGPAIEIPAFTYELWKWGHLCDSLWHACHVLPAITGRADPKPERVLTKCWAAIQTLLAGGAIYLDEACDDYPPVL